MGLGLCAGWGGAPGAGQGQSGLVVPWGAGSNGLPPATSPIKEKKVL